jgi:hypothetical protein
MFTLLADYRLNLFSSSFAFRFLTESALLPSATLSFLERKNTFLTTHSDSTPLYSQTVPPLFRLSLSVLYCFIKFQSSLDKTLVFISLETPNILLFSISHPFYAFPPRTENSLDNSRRATTRHAKNRRGESRVIRNENSNSSLSSEKYPKTKRASPKSSPSTKCSIYVNPSTILNPFTKSFSQKTTQKSKSAFPPPSSVYV